MSDRLAVTVTEFNGAERRRREDTLAREEPLEISLRYAAGGEMRQERLAVTMRTPGHDEDLAAGFLLGEGIIKSSQDIAVFRYGGAEALRSAESNRLIVTLAAGLTPDMERLQRHVYTSSSCGVCGKASLESLEIQGVDPVPNGGARFHADMLSALPASALPAQSLHRASGGAHAAALFDAGGQILALREDIGRHNAMDKLLGRCLRESLLPLTDFGLLVSGRASFELLQKAAVAGAGLFVAVGAPSSLAVDLARDFNITLLGFNDGHRFNLYHDSGRVVA